MIPGERQMAHQMENIRPDHRARYILASSYIKPQDKVLDAVCGIGYGTKLMAQLSSGTFMAFDRDQEAIEMAKRHYDSPKIGFLRADFTKIHNFYPAASFNVITCFEAIEHVEDDVLLLTKLESLLADNGTLLISTPNQKKLPWSETHFPEHVKHYYKSELDVILELTGFRVENWFNQKDKQSFSIGAGSDGNFMIAVCRKL